MAHFKTATINTLGHSHTVGDVTYRSFADSDVRMRLFLRILRAQAYVVVGLQEFQTVQQRMFNRWTSGWGMHVYADNAVIWRRLKFKLLDKGALEVPYFGGNMRRMPWVLLQKRSVRRRNRKRFFYIDVHNPANVHGPAERHRRTGWNIEAHWAKQQLEEHPGVSAVIVVGDKNDPDYGPWVREHGGRVSGFPDIRGIDWIAGWGDVRFEDHNTFETPRVDDMTDHPITEATAVVF